MGWEFGGDHGRKIRAVLGGLGGWRILADTPTPVSEI